MICRRRHMASVQRALYAIVPVKILARAKTRLAPSLSFAQRLRLAREFLHHTLNVTHQYPGPNRTIIVSADACVLQMARTRKMIALPQTTRGGINRAVTLGCQRAMSRGAGAVLVVPTDLPLLSISALRLFTRSSVGAIIRIAPDRHNAGTNALYMQPVRAHFAKFGDDSFRRHQTLAADLGITGQIVRNSTLAFDIDTPEDLTIFSDRAGHAAECKTHAARRGA